MERTVTPEWLDLLPADDPGARHSRRDLRLFNLAMGNHRWWTRHLPARRRAGEPALELGAGDGRLARRFGLDAVDLAPAPNGWPAALVWHRGDLLTFTQWPVYPVVVANLTLHHFPNHQLSTLGAVIRRHARVFLAVEPVRSRRHQALFAVLCQLIGAHAVSRHDGRASIAAGFTGDELPRLLGLTSSDWRVNVRCTWRGAYCLTAERISA